MLVQWAGIPTEGFSRQNPAPSGGTGPDAQAAMKRKEAMARAFLICGNIPYYVNYE
jgi:hypothetical protein